MKNKASQNGHKEQWMNITRVLKFCMLNKNIRM